MEIKYKRYIFTIIMITVLMITSTVSSLAMSDENINSQIKGPKYIYKTEYFPAQQVTVHSYPAGQSTGGDPYHSKNDGVLYALEGGSNISISVGMNFGPWGIIPMSASFDFGICSSPNAVGQIHTIDKYFIGEGRYKFKVYKTYTIRPYVILRRRSGYNQNWEPYHYSYSKSYYSWDYEFVYCGSI